MCYWVSVKDKRPLDIWLYREPSPEVLVKHPLGITVARQFSNGTWIDQHSKCIENVTHWSELPLDSNDEQTFGYPS